MLAHAHATQDRIESRVRTKEAVFNVPVSNGIQVGAAFHVCRQMDVVLDAVEAARVFARAARGKVPPKGQRLDHVDWLVAIATIICRAGSNQKALKVDRCRCAGARSTYKNFAEYGGGVVNVSAASRSKPAHGLF